MDNKLEEAFGILLDGTAPNKADDEWTGMPEFVQDKKEPFSKLIIRFETEEDLNAFAAKIGQKLTPKTKSIWYPFKSHWGTEKKIYIDES